MYGREVNPPINAEQVRCVDECERVERKFDALARRLNRLGNYSLRMEVDYDWHDNPVRVSIDFNASWEDIEVDTKEVLRDILSALEAGKAGAQ